MQPIAPNLNRRPQIGSYPSNFRIGPLKNHPRPLKQGYPGNDSPGNRVTICIAAICNDKIVTVSDSKVSFGGDYSADGAVVKLNLMLARNWMLLFSGSDIMDQGFISSRAQEILSAQDNLTDTVVSDAVHRAYNERLHRQIEAQVLARYGFDLESFLQAGKKQLTETIYNELCAKIAAVTLSLQFIVAGFDPGGKARLVYVDGHSAPASYDSIGYCAIGSGMNSALSSLAFHADRGAFRNSDLATCVYCCCAAKFMAESASDVGKETFVIIRERDDIGTLFPPDIEQIREAWNREGAPRVPKEIVATIPLMLKKVSDLFEGVRNEIQARRSNSVITSAIDQT